jgi:glycosyltransferase involved in cell wall biosynthesis
VWDESNPWHQSQALAPDQPSHPDILFLGGTDWRNLSQSERERSPVPILNLVQHVRHGFSGDPRYPFLRHRAIRICVSEQVAESIRSTGTVEGPIFTIPNGLDHDRFPEPIPFAEKNLDFVIAALKQPGLGRRLSWLLWRPGRRIHLLTHPVPRAEFLGLVNRARITVFLPHQVEGFYIPPLEGMGLGTIVVCPDCLGNRSFCLADRNCFLPALSTGAIRAAAEAASRLAPAEAERRLAAARETFALHDLQRERRSFLEILGRVDELW